MAKVVVGVAVAVIGTLNLLRHLDQKRKDQRLIPRVQFTKGGDIKKVERFGDYVVRQLGLNADTPAAKNLAKVAEDYLRGDKSSSDSSRENVCILASRGVEQKSDKEIKHMNEEVLKELDACILAYFSFHWAHSSALIQQVVSTGGGMQSKLRRAVLSATRKHKVESRKEQYQELLRCLSTKRAFLTLVEQLKALGSPNISVPDKGQVMVVADSSVRSPVLLLIGGGMGAGKSTVVNEILKGSFWSGAAHNAVVVEADAFKETDVIYRALSSMGQDDMAGTAQFVHQFSTNAASSLLVSALNEGRDVIFDGTMSWEPFFLQTIAMARDIHRRRYRMGPGYHEGEDGVVVEKYWEPVPDDCNGTNQENGSVDTLNGETLSEKKINGQVSEAGRSENVGKKPYRIEFVGVTCDAHLTVVRGMRRAILTKRGVPIKGQLRSHKLFAKSLDKYIEVVDHAKIYSTSRLYGPAELIGVKDGPRSKLLIDCDTFPGVRHLVALNVDAGSVLDLYNGKLEKDLRNQMWHDLVLEQDRGKRQARLRSAIYSNCSNGQLLGESDNSSNGGGSPASSFNLAQLQSSGSGNSSNNN